MRAEKLFPKYKYGNSPLYKNGAVNAALCDRIGEIVEIVTDSRRAAAASVFVCIRGADFDGHSFAQKAYDSGCRVFLCERKLDISGGDFVEITVKNSKLALCDIAARFYGFPSSRLRLIGITGTKGKSTVSEYIYSILKENGYNTGIIGTIGIKYADKQIKTNNTTPDALVLNKTFADMLRCGIDTVVMEISSQSYLVNRVDGIRFDYGIYTNLSEDHIGQKEHPTFENYAECKAKLFRNSDVSIINTDTEYSDYFASNAKGKTVYYSIDHSAEYQAENIENTVIENRHGMKFDIDGQTFGIKMPGEFTVYNALAAISVCREIGISYRNIASALEKVSVKGRFETVYSENGISFIIDYSHNAIALETALTVLRGYSPGRLVVLFGSVGGRSELRRTEMGHVAAALADFSIITSDNPDFENPENVIRDIEKAIGNKPHICITDREKAIRYAVDNAKSGDIVLFAGKGHEDYQLICGKKIPFCERDIILDETDIIKNNVLINK